MTNGAEWTNQLTALLAAAELSGTVGMITDHIAAAVVRTMGISEDVFCERVHKPVSYTHLDVYKRQMRDFVRAVQSGGDGNLSSARVSLQSHLICFAAERSRVERRIVEL